MLFELLTLGKAANPVIVLDEIDKINRPSEQVQASLYSVLEPISAQHLRNISLTFEFDASLVTWIATANDARRLDRPLLNRFREFHISAPTAEQSLVLAMEVIRATIESAGVGGFCQDTGRTERDIAHLPAREIQQVVQVAIARAVSAGRTHLRRQDLPAHVLDATEAVVHRNGYLH